MLPNVSTLDAEGYLWICINPRCPELHAGELDAADLEEAGVPQALAGRVARLILHRVGRDEALPPAAPPPKPSATCAPSTRSYPASCRAATCEPRE